MSNIEFKELMFGYAAEDSSDKKIKVYIPDLFPDKRKGAAIDYKTNNGSAKNIIINKNAPSISNMLNNKNYLTLLNLNSISVSLNDKLIIGFVHSNPKDGVIFGKAG